MGTKRTCARCIHGSRLFVVNARSELKRCGGSESEIGQLNQVRWRWWLRKKRRWERRKRKRK